MKIKAYQSEVDKWIKSIGVRYFNELTNNAVLMEEVGEFSRLIARKYGEQSFKNKEDEEKVDEMIADEIADIFFVLTCLANQMQIDITEALERNMEKKTKRDIERHKHNKKLSNTQ